MTQKLLKLCAYGLTLSLVPIVSNSSAGTPNCQGVSEVVATSSESKEISSSILKHIYSRSRIKTSISKVRTINKTKNWYIAEVEFKSLEPGIYVIQDVNGKYIIKTEYSGFAEVDDQVVYLQERLSKEVPKAPKELIRCFKPKGSPFLQD